MGSNLITNSNQHMQEPFPLYLGPVVNQEAQVMVDDSAPFFYLCYSCILLSRQDEIGLIGKIRKNEILRMYSS